MAKVVNGIRGNSNEVKYPVNCSARVMQPAVTGAGSLSEAELDELYEPKPDKKVVRVVTVIGYMFSVSLGAIVLSLYYLFLWNPYKNTSKLSGEAKYTTALFSNFTSNSNFESPESITSAALHVQPSTVSNLLNSSTLFISAASLIGNLARGVKDNSMNINATPKTLSYKQKRSSEKLLTLDDSKLKTSFSPFFLKPAKFSSKKKELLIRPNKVFEGSVINNDYKINGAKKKKFDTKSIRKEDQADMKISLQSLGSLDNASPTIKSQYEMYKPFYLEDPFTTYAKAQRAKGNENTIQGVRHHFFRAKERINENSITNQIVREPVDIQASSRPINS